MTLSMDYCKNILQTIGNTPLVKLNNVAADIPALVLAKVETFNPPNHIFAKKHWHDQPKNHKSKFEK